MATRDAVGSGIVPAFVSADPSSSQTDKCLGRPITKRWGSAARHSSSEPHLHRRPTSKTLPRWETKRFFPSENFKRAVGPNVRQFRYSRLFYTKIDPMSRYVPYATSDDHNDARQMTKRAKALLLRQKEPLIFPNPGAPRSRIKRLLVGWDGIHYCLLDTLEGIRCSLGSSWSRQ